LSAAPEDRDGGEVGDDQNHAVTPTALFLRRDRPDPVVVLPWQTWAGLVPCVVLPGRSGNAANAKIAYWRKRPPRTAGKMGRQRAPQAATKA
jgi:hypothetical protein